MTNAKTYTIDPFTIAEEKVLVRESIPFKCKGKTAELTEKNFVRAAFNLMLPFLNKTDDAWKGVL